MRPPFVLAFALAAGLSAGFAPGLVPEAGAQGVDRYEFSRMRQELDALSQEVGRLRGTLAANASSGGLEEEFRRLTDQVERLGHAQRQLEAKVDQKLLDLEYRVIELEGGDPSVLFQQGGSDPASPTPAPAAPPPPAAAVPVPPPAAPSGGGSLGTLSSPAPATERAAFDEAVASYRAGRPEEARRRLESFLTAYPSGELAAEAHYWLGESLFSLGEYRGAASRFLDASTLDPSAPTAPEAMLKLGVTFGLLGNRADGCLTLREVRLQFPGAVDQIARAAAEAARAGCS